MLWAVMIVVAGAATIFVGCKKEKDEAKYYTEAGNVSKEDNTLQWQWWGIRRINHKQLTI